MLAHERQAIILDLLQKNRVIKISDISSRFGVSTLTARRDLDVLQNQNLVRRVYGGAILLSDSSSTPASSPAYLPDHRGRNLRTEKEAIGKLAASMVREGDILFLGSGTTILEVARNIRHMSNLTIISGSLAVINELASTNNSIHILGGLLDSSEHSVTGSLANSMLESFCADKVFISCDGFSLARGVTAYHPPGAEAGQIMMRNSAQSILVCGSHKFGINALSVVCPLSSLDMIITDDGLSIEDRDSIRNLGVDLRLTETHADSTSERSL